MKIRVYGSPDDAADAAAAQAADVLRRSTAATHKTRLVAATGNSQLQFLDILLQSNGIDWSNVELFHLDEYVGVGQDHRASFARYMQQRFIEPTVITTAHLIDGLTDPQVECARLNALLKERDPDLLFLGVGENGHLAFNDPPANVVTDDPYIVVTLDEACRAQQVGEGWFSNITKVPTQAISMSMQQILKAHTIIGVVTDQRKATAMSACFGREVTPNAPASYLRNHSDATLYADEAAVSKLSAAQLQTFI